MNLGKIARAAVMLAFVCPLAVPSLAHARYYHHYDSDEEGSSRTFNSPKVGGLLLDGCYQYPGECRTRREAQAFCRQQGYESAVDWHAQNSGGLFSTKRLGDGGTCFASCTVMTEVTCE